MKSNIFNFEVRFGDKANKETDNFTNSLYSYTNLYETLIKRIYPKFRVILSDIIHTAIHKVSNHPLHGVLKKYTLMSQRAS